MKMLLILTLELDDPEKVVDVLDIIDPDHLPNFSGTARVVVDPLASQLEKWLDEDE